MIFFRTLTFGVFFFFVFFSNVFSQLSDSDRFEISKQSDIFNAIFKEINLYYIDTLDIKQIVQNTIDYMLQQLDPYTEYISSENLSDFQFQTTGQYGGIGAIIVARDGKMIILETYEGMPADLAGLKPGDEIISINTENMKGKTISFAIERLKGQPNTFVKVEYLQPCGKTPQTITIKRKQIQTNPITYYGVVENNIGYIRLSSFTAQCASIFRKALIDLRKKKMIKFLIIDVRNNEGGLVNECLDILNFFLPKGKLLLSIKGKFPHLNKIYYAEKLPIEPDLPLAILVNKNSASASEILSGTIQDTDRGIIVGSCTYGKGLVQSVRPLPYRGKLKLTTAKYYIPSGRCIQTISFSHKKKNQDTQQESDTKIIHTYYTTNHRQVIGEKGISPDLEIKEEPVPYIVTYLENNWMFFDFTIQWRLKHSSIDSPKNFILTKNIYQEFKEFAQNQTKQTIAYYQSSEEILASLQKAMELEGIFGEAKEEFSCLKNKMKPKLNCDLNLYKDPVAYYLALTMMKHYFFNKGKLIYQLRFDSVIKETTRILQNKTLYDSILHRDF